MRTTALVALLCALFCAARGIAEDSSTGASAAGQSAADALHVYTGAEGALIPAGLISKPAVKSNLASILTYPTDGVEVLDLTGAQIKEAFERSISLYPESNVGFLQVSGFNITFSKSGPPNGRVASVFVNGTKLDEAHTYEVAMPQSLASGELGYSGLWDKAKVVRTYEKADLGTVFAGKKITPSAPRWQPAG